MNKIIVNKTLKTISIILFGLTLMTVGYYFYPEKLIPNDTKIERILVEKSKREMLVFSMGRLIKTYKISLGFHPLGKKHFENDGKTPEGKYYIISKNEKSIAYKSLGLSYPNSEDRKYAIKYRLKPGGNIMIHGLMNEVSFWGKFHRFIDWTGGCIALTNKEMENLFKHVEIGCEVDIIK